jgi:hypothetical protein
MACNEMKENDALGLNYQFDNQIVRSECGRSQSPIQGKERLTSLIKVASSGCF